MLVEDKRAIGAVMTDGKIDHRMIQRSLRVIVQQIPPDCVGFQPNSRPGQRVGILTLGEIEQVDRLAQGVDQPPQRHPSSMI